MQGSAAHPRWTQRRQRAAPKRKRGSGHVRVRGRLRGLVDANGSRSAERSEARRSRFDRLYEENSGPILAYALRRVEQPADAADVVANTFLAAWRRLDDIPDGDRARLWLYGTARRVLANHYRSHRRAVSLNSKLISDLGRTVEDVDAQLSGPGRSEIVHAFRRLSGDDQEVLLLVGVEGLERQQAAETLGVSRAAVRLRLHRARRRFEDELRRVGIDPQRSAAAGHEERRRAPARRDREDVL